MHIVPLGWEVDRVVLPIRAMCAHRAYLLCQPRSDPKRSHYLTLVTKALTKMKVHVVHREVDSNLDAEGLVREMSAIIQYEESEGSSVHINISGAGKVAATAAHLVACAHLNTSTGTLYYPVAERYTKPGPDREQHGLGAGMEGEPLDQPFFRLEIPRDDARRFLQLLVCSPKGELRYAEAIEHLRSVGYRAYEVPATPGGSRGVQRNRANVALNKRVVEKLKRGGFVEVEARGRERVAMLTESGRFMAMLCAPPLTSPSSRT